MLNGKLTVSLFISLGSAKRYVNCSNGFACHLPLFEIINCDFGSKCSKALGFIGIALEKENFESVLLIVVWNCFIIDGLIKLQSKNTSCS